MVEAKQSQYEFDEAMAELANELAPLKYGFDNLVNSIKTGFIKVITEAIKGVKDLIDKLKELFDQQQKNSQQSLNNSMRPSDSGILALSASPAAPMFAQAQPRSQVMSFAGGEQVMTAPAVTRALSTSTAGLGLSGFSVTDNSLIGQLLDTIKGMTSGTTQTINNDISINVTVDGMDGFMEILQGLQDYPLTEQQGWAGF